MCDLCRLIFGLVVDLFRSRVALEAEVLVLKQQIIVLRRGKPHRQSFVGCTAYPRRTAQARDRCRADQRCQVYGAQERSAVAGLEDVPPQPRKWDRGDGFVCRSDRHRLLYGLLIMGHGRRQILWLGVTAHPTAEWIANQLTAACGWEQLPRYLIRDRDACYGDIFVRRIRSLGIRDYPTSARSPWQNGYAERLIGSIRRECLVSTGRCCPLASIYEAMGIPLGQKIEAEKNGDTVLIRGSPVRRGEAIAHAKRELVAKQRPPGWVPPNMFQLPKVLTEAEVIEAEAELKALQRHALEVVDPEAES